MTTTRPTQVRDRGQVIGEAMSWLARWSLRLTLIAVGATLLWLLLAQLWVIMLPVLLAVLIATVLWPPTAWLRRHHFPPALAAATVLVGALAIFTGTFALLAPSAINEFDDILSGASGGLQQIRQWVAGPPSTWVRPSSTRHCKQ